MSWKIERLDPNDERAPGIRVLRGVQEQQLQPFRIDGPPRESKMYVDTLPVEDVGFRAEGVGQVHVRVAFDVEERTIYMSAPRVNGGVPVSPKRFALEILREAEKRAKTWPIPLAARIHTVATHVSPRARVALILMGDVEAARCPT